MCAILLTNKQTNYADENIISLVELSFTVPREWFTPCVNNSS